MKKDVEEAMKREPLRVGLIGYGSVGQDVSRIVSERAMGDIALVGALVRSSTKTRPSGPPIVTTLSALLAEQPDVVVEVAGHEGLRQYGCAVLRRGVDLVFISVGVLADAQLFREFIEAAQSGGAQAKLASGAIGGLDALTAASLGGLTKVIHIMRKPPHELGLHDELLADAREVFRGSARQAAFQFPSFLNVAAAVAFASNGLDQTEVRVIADPRVEHSLHEIQAEGAFGSLRFEIENAPVSTVPMRGARLVAMSIVHTLLLRRAPFAIG